MKFVGHVVTLDNTESRPARGAWIEIIPRNHNFIRKGVAPRKGRVD